MNEKRLASLLSFLAMASLGTVGVFAQPAPLGPEIRVNTVASDRFPNCPLIGVHPMGAFTIAWDYGSNLPPEVAARTYAASGVPVSPQVFVGSEGFFPVVDAVTPLSYGNRILFHVMDDRGEDPPKFFRRRINPNGGVPRTVGAADTLWVWPGVKETLLAGKYQAAMKQLIAQKVAGNGKPAGFEYVLNSRPIEAPIPRIVPLDDRRFAAVFAGRSPASDTTPERQVLRARRFSVSGPLGPDFDVNNIPGGVRGSQPSLSTFFAVAANRFAKLAVAWWVFNSNGGGSTIHLRVFNSAGVPTGPEVVAVGGDGFPEPVSMALNDSGEILLLYHYDLSNPFRRVLEARLFNSLGAPIGPAFKPDSVASSAFEKPFCGSVGWAKDVWILTWAAQGTSSIAIFVRRFAD